MVTGYYSRINGRKQLMDLHEQRIIGSLLLLAGITFFAAGFATGQLTTVMDILSKVLGAAIAG
jgi:hypothetical protein